MCAAANPTPMAFRPLKTCWPTSCWGSSCGWSLPPLVSATSLSSACVHTSDLRINCTPCASSPSAVSHNTFKVKTSLIFFYFTIFCLFFIILNLIYAIWHGKSPCHGFETQKSFSSAGAQKLFKGRNLPWKYGAVSLSLSSDSSQVEAPYELHLWLFLIDIQHFFFQHEPESQMECGKEYGNIPIMKI